MVAESAELIAAARALAPRVQACADEVEQERRLPPALVDELRAAGLFRMWIPRELGGLDTDPLTFYRVVEEISQVDGATGWNLMIGAGNAIIAGWLCNDVQREVFGRDPGVVTGGVYGPRGRALAVPGGYRVTGRWPFGSGGQHCAWMVGGCFVFDGETQRRDTAGAPLARIMLFRAGEFAILDTWRTAGLRGSGSHDYAVHDLFVPEEHTFSFNDPPLRPETLYRLPRFGLLASCISAVQTGIARHAIDALVELAQAKTPTGQTSLLRERAVVQADVARAEALLRAARAFRTEALQEAWQAATEGTLTVGQRAALLLAAAHASATAAQAVDLMYNAGGATAIYERSPLERCFRDVHTATAHYMVGPGSLEVAGRALLGFDMTDSAL